MNNIKTATLDASGLLLIKRRQDRGPIIFGKPQRLKGLGNPHQSRSKYDRATCVKNGKP